MVMGGNRASCRSTDAEGTAVPSARFTPHLRVVLRFAQVFRNLSRRTVHYRGLYLLRLTTAGRFALRASAHWAHASLRRHLGTRFPPMPFTQGRLSCSLHLLRPAGEGTGGHISYGQRWNARLSTPTPCAMKWRNSGILKGDGGKRVPGGHNAVGVSDPQSSTETSAEHG